MKAWSVKVIGWEEIDIITAAPTRSKAISLCWNASEEVGYGVAFTRYRARRAPEFDQWAATMKTPKAWCREYVEQACASISVNAPA